MKYFIWNPETKSLVRDNGMLTQNPLVAMQFQNKDTARRYFKTYSRTHEGFEIIEVKSFSAMSGSLPRPATSKTQPIPCPPGEYIEELIPIIEKITGLKDDFVQAEKVFKTASQNLSQYDKAVSDILHKIENEKLNAVGQCALFRRLKEILTERRKMKNTIDICNHILAAENSITVDLRSLNTVLTRIGAPQYTPKVLTELFAQDTGKAQDLA